MNAQGPRPTVRRPRVRRAVFSSRDAAPRRAAPVEVEHETIADADTDTADTRDTMEAVVPTERLPPLPPPPHVDADDLAAMEEADSDELAEERVAPALDQGWAVPHLSLEPILWIATLAGATLVRLASLTNTPYSVPESQRAYAALQWAQGQPVRVDGHLWGPFPLLMDAIFFFLFGARDAIGRLAPALVGITLVALCGWLRPYFGRWGALGTAAMVALSPAFVYTTRQVTGIPYAALAALALFVCLLRVTEDRPTTATLLVGVTALVVLLGSGPEGLTMLLALALALAAVTAFAPRDADAPGTARLMTNLRAVDRRVLSGAIALGVVLLLIGFTLFFTDAVHLPRTVGHVFGDWWGNLFATQRAEPWYFYLIAAFVYEPFIGTTAIVGIVIIARMARPRPVRFVLPLVWQLLALLLFSFSGGKSPEATAMLLLSLAIIGGVAVQWVAEEMAGGWFWHERGWALGLGAFLTVLTAVQFLRQLKQADRSPTWLATVLSLIVIVLVVGYITATLAANRDNRQTATALIATLIFLAGVIGVRAMSDLVFARPADGQQLLVGTRTAPGVTALVDRIQRISVDLTRQARTFDPARNDRNNVAGGNTLAVEAESSLEWPLRWYFRDYPNFAVGDLPTLAALKPTLPDGTDAPRIVLVPTALEGQATTTFSGYTAQRTPFTVSFPAAYRALDSGGVLRNLTSGRFWADATRYFLSRATRQPPTTTNATVLYSKDVASRIFYINSGGNGAQTTGANLFDKAGRGKGGGQFAAPRGITVGPDGTITVMDQQNYRAQQFSPEGTLLREFGGPGTTPDKFGRIEGYSFGPTGLAVDKDGNLYVADTWNHRISVFMSTGQPLRQWGAFFNGQTDPGGLAMHQGDFYGPRGVAIGPDGLVYVTDAGNGRVSVFTTAGMFVRSIGTRGAGPGQLDDAIGIAVRQDGTIAVADPNNARVQLFSADGKFLASLPIPDWGTARGLEPYPAWLPNGNLLVPSPTTNKVYEITQAGQMVRTLTGDFHKPTALTLTTDGKAALVINDETNTVVRVNL